MASATFPAAFNYMTLRDFYEPPDCPDHGGVCYVHVFDGGNSDNLGLISIKRVLLSDRARATSEYERIVVVFVDAFRRSLGVSPSSADPRGVLSYVIDTNFLDATGSLLEANRQRILEDFFARTIAAYERVADCRRDNLPDHACAARWRHSCRRSSSFSTSPSTLSSTRRCARSSTRSRPRSPSATVRWRRSRRAWRASSAIRGARRTRVSACSARSSPRRA